MKCPDCGCPNEHCACILRARLERAERDRDRWARERQFYLRLWQAAAACLRHNGDRLKKPRGEDERRMLEWAERNTGSVGATDGIIAEPPRQQTDLSL